MRLLLLPFCFLFCTTITLQAQELVPRGGEYFCRDAEDWYNRKAITTYLRHIYVGEPEKVLPLADAREGDVEADFVRALAYAYIGETEKSLGYVKASLEKEMPFGRYLAGPAKLMQPLVELPGFKALAEKYPTPLVHGPMVGKVTGNSATFWCRTDQPRKVQVEVSRDKSFRKVKSATGRTQSADGHTAELTVKGLKPGLSYFYRLSVDGQPTEGTYQFTTHPKAGKPGQFSVVFGGGAAYIPWQHYMWSTIQSHRPDALFMLGDNVYIDYPEQPYLQQYCYHRRQSEPHWRKLVAQTPTYAIWDDHDFGDNDEYGTPDPDSPAWKRPVLDLFKRQWVDPGYGDETGKPGVFFKHSIADVDFFFLDCRYYRQPSEVGAVHEEPLSMLGEAQKAWLKSVLLESDAKVKVLISSVPWAFDAKPALEGRIDTWGGYKAERNEIFDFLTENNIKGVFLLSADRHRSDIWKIERPNDYPLYEFESSKLTNMHTHKIMPGSEYGYNEKCSFGQLLFDTTGDIPEVTYRIINIDNVVVNEFTWRANDQ
ncbi:alkaline phosphatase D family protein [Phaeodactylibacter xiamenensis]|uniref:alkaline phosphatase D family protein n=1 Tax=Phaeodactylibacter xiamenensis TaxID=1524460 RepID=UPI003CCBA23D